MKAFAKKGSFEADLDNSALLCSPSSGMRIDFSAIAGSVSTLSSAAIQQIRQSGDLPM